MTIKNRTIGALACFVATLSNFAGTLLAYSLPRKFFWHGVTTLTIIDVVIYLIDALNSDSLSKNIVIMRKSGVPDWEMWTWPIMSVVAKPMAFSQVLFHLFGLDNDDWNFPRANDVTVTKLLLCIALVWSTDPLFYMGHKFLHEYLPAYHVMHHANVYSSHCTNLFFHPVDLFFEVVPPLSWVTFVCYFILQDAWLFALTGSVMTTWYAMNHDEWLGLHHVHHHRACSSSYFNYVRYFYSDKNMEGTRQLVSEFQKLDKRHQQ